MKSTGLPSPHQQARCKSIFICIIFEFLQLRRQPLPVAAGAEGQLPRHQRRQAGEAVQQQLVPLLTQGILQHQAQLLRLYRKGIQLVGFRRLAVKQAGQKLPLTPAKVAVHPADAVDDAPLPVQQQEVGAAAHGLQHQAALHPVAQLVQGLQPEFQNPLQRRLVQLQNPRPLEVLAQEHAEHRGLLRVLPVEGGQVGPGMAGVGGEEQAHVLPLPPYIKHHLVPGGLVELVNLASGHGGTELRGHRREAQCV